MVRLTCLLRRKDGLTPAEFHEHWREVHGPLIAPAERRPRGALRAAPAAARRLRRRRRPGLRRRDRAVVREHGRYRAHMAEPDFPEIWADIERFLDTDQLHFVVTEHPRLVMGDDAASFPLA